MVCTLPTQIPACSRIVRALMTSSVNIIQIIPVESLLYVLHPRVHLGLGVQEAFADILPDNG